MKRVFNLSIALMFAVLTYSQNTLVNIHDIAVKVADKGLSEVDLGDYKGSCLLHSLSDLALASGDSADMTRIENILLGFTDGRVKPYSGNSFYSYNVGGSGAAWLAFKGVKSLLPQVCEGAEHTWNNQLRNLDNVMIPFYYSLDKNPVFIDVAFAVTPFFLYAGLCERNDDYIDYSVYQIMQVYRDLKDDESGLLQQARGVAQLKKGEKSTDNWSRGNGWGSMAFTSLMRDLPKKHPQRKAVLEVAKEFYLSCLKYQDENGLWHQEMTDFNSYVETSGSALVLAGIGAAIENNVLSRRYLPQFEKGLKALLSYIDADGSVGHTCMSNLAPGNGSKEAYKLRHYYFNEPHAFGPVVFALAQALRLGFKEVILDSPLGSANGVDRPRTYVRFVKERKEDIAWENDRVAFRVYSRLIGDKSMSGVDYWAKSVDYSIIDSWYRNDSEGRSYHRDYGEGCDFYTVGKNCGLGGSAIYADGRLIPSQTYANYRINRNDNAHIDFVLQYQPFEVGGVTVYDTKRIEMVLGTNYYKVTQTVESSNGEDLVLAVGLSTFGNEEVKVRKDKGLVSVVEEIAVPEGSVAYNLDNEEMTSLTLHSAIVADPSSVMDIRKIGSNEVVLLKVRSNEPVVYYVGAGWSGQMYDSRFRGTTAYWNSVVTNTSWAELNKLYAR
ncbi:DUF4861 family protein [Bacteroides uniformis]|uniref:DUF4861 family protein n=1 Tax=Bacteroides uniformis TaxID=820 RepID=UPI00189996FC|nr:glycoside hydrolase family 88 protein [Bacteroides uniformis]